MMNNRRCSAAQPPVIHDVVPAGLGIENSTDILQLKKLIFRDSQYPHHQVLKTQTFRSKIPPQIVTSNEKYKKLYRLRL
jgi:hypothetical protein